MSEQLRSFCATGPIVPPESKAIMADLGVVRAAIFDVIDGGDSEIRFEDGRRLAWALDHPFEGVATEARGRFVDAVTRRIQELQLPPHNLGVRLQNFCPYHIAKRLGLPNADDSVQTCADCDARDGR